MSKENIETIYPLSPMQEGMLFHTLYAPTSGVYFEQLSCALVGALDLAVFQQAWQHIVNRHAALRTLFVWENRDKPLQVVRQRAALTWTYHDWRGLTPAEQEQRLASFLAEDRTQGFDLMQAPLMRCTIIHIDDTLHQFVWSFHHLLLDGWSVSQVLQEAFAVYEALGHQQPARLDSIRPYRDYIAWLQKQETAKAETFWRQTLAGFDAPTPLGGRPISGREIYPTDQERDHAKFRVRLDLKTTTALQAIAKQYRLTLNTLTQGAWAILLSRYAGMQDVLFGVTVSGRPAEIAGIENMVGLFINTLPLRVHIPAQGTLLAWLQTLQTHQADTRQYEYCSLIDIQKWSDVPANRPLFESILVFENYPAGTILQSTSIPLDEANRWYKADGLEIRNIRFFERTNYPLTIAVEPGAELVLEFNYNPVHFNADAVRRMARHLQTLLEAIPSHLEQPPVTLPMLSAAERQQILVEWNATQVDFPDEQCVHQLFEAQVERTPDAVAVVFEQQTLTYRELNERANQLAHYLQKLGVGPESLVALCLERSLEMVVGIFGVLKAGGAYIPLEPTYPQERLNFMLEDSQASILLSQQIYEDKLSKGHNLTIYLDKDWRIIQQEPNGNPINKTTLANLAYIIYTSGSTGQPKGVMISHKGLSNYLNWCTKAYKVMAGQGSPVHSPISFDLTITGLFPPLLTGRTVVLLPETRNMESLITELHKNKDFSLMKITPAHLEILNQQLSPEQADGQTRALIIGGEALYGKSLEFWQKYAPNTRLINEYGPTETVVGSCIYEMPTNIPSSDPVPIGRPIANTQLYLLDAYLQPVGIGLIGELHIGGFGVARGYLNRPGMTAEKFIPDPFSHVPGARLYKTGDLARYLSDGNIEYIGRTDNQIKLRGFRVELGEIEAHLEQHPTVRNAVVVAREDTPGDKRLVAYITARAEQHPTADILRQALQTMLPDYMIPAAFIVLDAFPLTANGKVNHNALPTPDWISQATPETYIAPGTDAEEALAKIWQDVLGLPKIGVYDNFFTLGGHSLLATRVISRVRQMFQVTIPLRVIFETPTIAGLATALETILIREVESLSDTEAYTQTIDNA